MGSCLAPEREVNSVVFPGTQQKNIVIMPKGIPEERIYTLTTPHNDTIFASFATRNNWHFSFTAVLRKTVFMSQLQTPFAE